MEQEFFLVDAEGAISNRADEFLALYRDVAKELGRDPESFAPETSLCMMEVDVPPARSVAELSREYLDNLEVGLRAGREAGLRLYPLATYPLAMEAEIRDEFHYRFQARTTGSRRFENAGHCTGAHLHLEAPENAIDPRVGVSYEAEEGARKELLNLYNLATALDTAILALTRSCPYYEGRVTGLAVRAALYRGDPDLAPHGLYARFKEVGGLQPYAESDEELVEMQFSRYHAWLSALDRAGVDRQSFYEMGGGLLQSSSWNPVRLNPVGTVELRGFDGNYPRKILAVASLVESAAGRVRRERLAVLPHEDAHAFEVAGDTLLVPDYEHLSEDLFRTALTEGIESKEVVSYLDSILEFAHGGQSLGAGNGASRGGFEDLKIDGRYRTTEAEILQKFPPEASGRLSEKRGLELVREACDELEEQVASLQGRKPTKAGTDGD